MPGRRPTSQPLSVRVPDAIGGWLHRVLPLRLVALLYRVGHLAMRPVWLLTRPAAEGSKVAVFRGDQILFVRLTYGARRQWDLPGGTRMTGESPKETAVRELQEETGLGGQLEAVGSWEPPGRKGRGRLHGFVVTVEAGQEPVIDPAEIAEARWFDRARLPGSLADSTELVLEAALRSRPAPPA